MKMTLELNNKKLTGVYHHKLSTERYDLRRYFPEAALEPFIEQLWLVDWDLRGEVSHIQQNLPDPNFHLVFDGQKLKLIGPISKAYSYTMEGKGKLRGIKFELGALERYLPEPISSYVDKELALSELKGWDTEVLLCKLMHMRKDQEFVSTLQEYMASFVYLPSPDLSRVKDLVKRIKSDSNITKVEHLSEKSALSIRSIQRSFKKYIGLTPKWLIRKYRLHQALELIEREGMSFLDIVEWLGYTDQSHLIRDFKEIIGTSPQRYLEKGNSK